jgi:hypothetical protein
MFVGGIAFMLLSFLASKYQSKQHKTITFAQDFISGSILIALLGVIVPDVFPAFPLSSSSVALPNFSSMLRSGGGDDIEIQVGPLRR